MKYSLKRILVPLDGSINSRRALDVAIYHAKQSDANIVGITVVPPKAKAFSYSPVCTKQDITNAKKILKDASKITDKENISFNWQILNGSAVGKEIVRFAKKSKSDLVVIGARGLGSVKEVFLGSVSNHVSHASRIPTLIVK